MFLKDKHKTKQDIIKDSEKRAYVAVLLYLKTSIQYLLKILMLKYKQSYKIGKKIYKNKKTLQDV